MVQNGAAMGSVRLPSVNLVRDGAPSHPGRISIAWLVPGMVEPHRGPEWDWSRMGLVASRSHSDRPHAGRGLLSRMGRELVRVKLDQAPFRSRFMDENGTGTVRSNLIRPHSGRGLLSRMGRVQSGSVSIRPHAGRGLWTRMGRVQYGQI